MPHVPVLMKVYLKVTVHAKFIPARPVRPYKSNEGLGGHSSFCENFLGIDEKLGCE